MAHLDEFLNLANIKLEFAKQYDKYFDAKEYYWIVGDSFLRPYVNLNEKYVANDATNQIPVLLGIKCILNIGFSNDKFQLDLVKKVI